jgi:hypothetical protein
MCGYWPEPQRVSVFLLNAAIQVSLFLMRFPLCYSREIRTKNMIQEHDVSVQIRVQWQGLAFAVGVCCKKVGHVLYYCF